MVCETLGELLPDPNGSLLSLWDFFIELGSTSNDTRWPHGQCAHLRIERSGFEPWPGTLCCVLGQDTLLSQCLSSPRCINGYRRI